MPPRRGSKSSTKPSSTRTTFDGSVPKISYELSFTKNLGDYESLKVSARIELDADYTEADLDKATDKLEVIREKLTERLVEDIQEITGN